MSSVGQIAFDDYGRPFIILRDQGNQKRLTGLDAHKVCMIILPHKKAVQELKSWGLSLYPIVYLHDQGGKHCK